MSAPFDFLGIGAQKAGTTWLWEMFREHPQVWLPPRKELHYFDRALTYPSPSFLATDQPLRRWTSRAPHDRQCRVKCWHAVRRHMRARDWPALRWDLRYYFGRFDDCWYLSLFAQGSGRVRGELTPSYSILDTADVARIARLAPALKIIFLLRNPIDRAWSQIRFDWTRGASQEIADPEKLRAFIESPMQALRGD
jgi:Sulfotransferase family